MKKKLLALSLTVICLSTLAYGTLAYFTAEDTAHNVITSGNVEIQLLEWADEGKTEPFPQNGVSGVLPGMQVTKFVEIKNTGSAAAWVRVRVDKQFTLAKDAEGQADPGMMTLDFHQEAWADGADGYYYYQKALASGETTEPLFAAITFDPAMGNLYQNSTASVKVLAYAVQSAHNGATPREAKGWPEGKEG